MTYAREMNKLMQLFWFGEHKRENNAAFKALENNTAINYNE